MLIFAHFLADYGLQSAWISKMKKIRRWPMIVHCSIYTGCIGYVISSWVDCSWWILGTIFLSHWLIDNFRIKFEASRRRIWMQRKIDLNKFTWLATFVDQTLHFCILILLMLKYC